MHAAILIQILLEITLFGFLFTTRGSSDYVLLSMNLEIIRSVFKQIFSRHQYFIDHLFRIYKVTLNFAELISKIRFLIFGRTQHFNHSLLVNC